VNSESEQKQVGSAIDVRSVHPGIATISNCIFYLCSRPNQFSILHDAYGLSLKIVHCQFSGSIENEVFPQSYVSSGNSFFVAQFPEFVPKWRFWVAPFAYTPSLIHIMAAMDHIRRMLFGLWGWGIVMLFVFHIGLVMQRKRQIRNLMGKITV
jgi:hypothetical protein